MNVRSHHRDRGTISVVMVILVIVVLAGGGLIVDGGRVMIARRHASNVAEGAARAAVATATPMSGFVPSTARAAAMQYAVRAGIDPADVVIVISPDHVEVTITERRSTVFLILGGRSTVTVRATGIARLAFSP